MSTGGGTLARPRDEQLFPLAYCERVYYCVQD
jgi:hypothetical protein